MARNKTSRNMVIGFYGHPEYYPPTLNAIANLSAAYDSIAIVHRNYPSFDWEYPHNVTLTANGKEEPIKQLEKASLFQKIGKFVKFTRLLDLEIRKARPDTILLYDNIAVLAYWLIRPLQKRARVLWYHNHDVTDLTAVRKYSINWWGWKAESWIFPSLDIFTLPAMERQQCFPMHLLKGLFLFLPNYPSLKIYERKKKILTNAELKILYQGSIGPMHGLEEIIELLDDRIQQFQPKLVLKGFVNKTYLSELVDIAKKAAVEQHLTYIVPGGYKSVIENARLCHIGIGIHKKQDIMNRTLGTASNKIYEYAASGMPVLLYNNSHFKQHLENAQWAFFTDCTPQSLALVLSTIAADYEHFSSQAISDFETTYNFERYFQVVLEKLQSIDLGK